MPRGGRRSSGRSSPMFGKASPPSRAPPRPVSSVPAARPASSVAQPATQQPRQPGLFGQMASTAAGVAIGSTVVSSPVKIVFFNFPVLNNPFKEKKKVVN